MKKKKYHGGKKMHGGKYEVRNDFANMPQEAMHYKAPMAAKGYNQSYRSDAGRVDEQQKRAAKKINSQLYQGFV